MHHKMGRFLAVLSSALLLLGTLAAGAKEAPFGDRVGAAAVNYNRATPNIATAGKLGDGGIATLKALGFKTILDLRGPDEGIDKERADVAAAGLRYVNIPVTTKAPAADQIAPFAAVIEDPLNWPVLVHCVSANRVGAMWALYRAAQGVPGEVAVEEGRAIGLKTSREKAVRLQLSLPPLPE